jgi:hypothetical protein
MLKNHNFRVRIEFCSNIPASPAYGVYISQLICYRHLHLRNKLLEQGYIFDLLKSLYSDTFNFPIVNILFICSIIPAASVCVVYISQFVFILNVLNRGLLLTRKLLNQGLKLKSSLIVLIRSSFAIFMYKSMYQADMAFYYNLRGCFLKSNKTCPFQKQDNEDRIRTIIYDKRIDFNFPIVNILFICSIIPVASVSVVYISQFVFILNFLNRGLLLTTLSQSKIFYSMKHNRINSFNLSFSVELGNVMSSIPIHSKEYWIQHYVYPFHV